MTLIVAVVDVILHSNTLPVGAPAGVTDALVGVTPVVLPDLNNVAPCHESETISGLSVNPRMPAEAWAADGSRPIVQASQLLIGCVLLVG